MDRASAPQSERRKRPLTLPQTLTGVCCDGSPERLVEPCLELNLFHDSANLPRLALRLRLRFSALSSRSEQPRSISAASLHFFPMRSSPCSARNARSEPGALPCSWALGGVSLYLACTLLSVGCSFDLGGFLPEPGSWVTVAATRLRLRPRLAQLWAETASAT